MAGFSDYYESKVLDHMLRGTAFTPPSTVYVALFTAAPTDAGGGTEVSGGGYARQSVAFGAPSGTAPTQIANSADVTFPVATASWGTVVAFGLFDAATAGNLLAWDNLTASKAIDVNDQAKFATGDLKVTLD
jgi:hypothetical protein